jgi:hypothetical protein
MRDLQDSLLRRRDGWLSGWKSERRGVEGYGQQDPDNMDYHFFPFLLDIPARRDTID